MRYVDSSRVALDDTCPKARYWGYEYQGRGLEGVEPNPDLAFGLGVANGIEQLRTTGVPPSGITDDAGILQQGLLQAYATRIWPAWLKEFELIGTEVEVGIQLAPDLYYMARPDAIIRRRADGAVFVLSDKTTSLNPESFVRIWDKAAQNHMECAAVEQTLGLTVQGFYTQGWYKGYKKDKTIYSPLCYAWCKQGQLGMVADKWSEKYVYGSPRRRIDEFVGGVAGWIKQLSQETITGQFPVAGPISVRRDLVETFSRQVIERECEIVIGATASFPQRFQHCDEFSKFRRPCAFKECCWAPTVGRDPLGSGLFRLRMPHHAPELAAMNIGGPVDAA
jgi:hypothetical protein